MMRAHASIHPPSMFPLLLLACTAASLLVSGVAQAATTITISGEVNDAKGLPLAGVNVRLYQLAPPDLDTFTDANGRYAFAQLVPGSYRVTPMLFKCTFTPSSLGFESFTSSATRFFSGSGPGCGGDPAVNAGATSGPLTIGGHVRDAAGNAVVGASVALSGSTTAIRFTDFTGGYTFHVDPGTYTVSATGSCAFTPASVKLSVSASTVQDFAAGAGCVTASRSSAVATGSVFTVQQGTVTLGTTTARIESNVADPAARLQEIAGEQPGVPSRSLVIAGNPAIERQATVTLGTLDPDLAGGTATAGAPFLALTAAIAVGSTVVRYESQLPADADATTIDRFFQADRNFTPDALPDLHGAALPSLQQIRNSIVPPAAPLPSLLAPGLLSGSYGELQVAASDTANVVVYGTADGPFYSKTGGLSVVRSTYNTVAAPGAASFVSLGDPTVGVGAPDASSHQAIYFAQLQQVTAVATGAVNPTVAIALYQSTDDGVTFNSKSFPVNCGAAGAGCVVPDQEQLAVDRVNRVTSGASQFDQMYLAWRNFTSTTNNAHTVAVACSRDGGATWTVDRTTVQATGSDIPRVGVGPDGSFAIVYSVYTNYPTSYSIRVQRWSSCASGFTPGTASVLATVTGGAELAGVDRTPLGNYGIAFDDAVTSAQSLYAVYVDQASAGNDDVHVAESTDGGASWPRNSVINTVGTGNRYFPSICSTQGQKYVTWYDRRNSFAASPDLTAFYRSSVFDNGSATTVGVSGETNLSGVDDPQCIAGFPNLVRDAREETQCTNLPGGFVPAGTCQSTCPPGVTGPCGSGVLCDFRAPGCGTTETCQATGRGVPKYGDYNQVACAQGTVFAAWASATPPAAASCVVDGLPCGSTTQCCSNHCVAGTCAPTTAACIPNGGACGGTATPCCSAGGGMNGLCQGGVCLPTIALYTACSGPGCPGVPIITYHQVGACNGFVDGFGGHFAGPNAAYVVFGIERIDNSQGGSAFSFDPANLFVQQTGGPTFFDSNLSIYTLFSPNAAVATTVAKGDSFSQLRFGALIVQTTNADGAVEADATPYTLLYQRQPGDPPVVLVKSNASQTSWPLTQDCTAIVLQ